MAWSTRFRTGPSPSRERHADSSGRRVSRETEGIGSHTFCMWKDADRYEDGEGDDDATPDLGAARDPDAYWRRRFFILGGGVAVIGVCALLFPGGHPAAARPAAAP